MPKVSKVIPVMALNCFQHDQRSGSIFPRPGAALYTGFGGMLGGKAIADVLCGEENPSGRLTDTWCERYENYPSAANFYDCRDGRGRFGADEDVWLDTVYEEDIYVGYRYFETFGRNGQVAWPFGYGLSYTQFQTEAGQCAYDDESGLRVSFVIKNVGEIPGKEVVQVYLAKPEGALERPEEFMPWRGWSCLILWWQTGTAA